MYRPLFIEPAQMEFLGFELLSDYDGYLKYQNNGVYRWNTDYGKFPESRGKVIIEINTNYRPDCFYLAIKQDAGTRTAYNGVCDSKIFLTLLLANIR